MFHYRFGSVKPGHSRDSDIRHVGNVGPDQARYCLAVFFVLKVLRQRQGIELLPGSPIN